MLARHARQLARHQALLLTALAVPLLLLVLGLAVHQLQHQRAMLLSSLEQAAQQQRQALDHLIRAADADLAGSGGGQLVQGFLDAVDLPVGQAWVVDPEHHVVAGPGSALPAALAGPTMDRLASEPPGFRPAGDHLVLLERLEAAPLVLLHTLPRGDLDRLIRPSLLAFALILLGFVLTVLAVQTLLQNRFIRPALALVRHIQRESDGSGERERVPTLWEPWFDAVSRAFSRSRDFQARLANSEARLKAAAESIPDGLAIFDAEDRLTFFNSHYPDHLTEGVRTTMALGKRWSEWGREAEALGPIYHPEMGVDYLRTRSADRELARVDREHRLIDGRWVRVREARMPDGGRVLLTTDVSDERRRRQEQMLLGLALAQAGDSVEITGADDRLLYVNPAFTRLTGYSPEEAKGRTPAELLRSTFHDQAFFDEIEATLAERRTWAGRIISRHKDGHPIYQDATISPIQDEDGTFAYSIAVKRDVSDRIRAEAALRESEARFLGAAESIPDGLVILDAEDRIVFYNSRHPELLPASLREVLRTGVRFSDWIREGLARGPVYHPDMGPAYAERRLASRGEALTEREHRHADGRWVRIRESRMPGGGRVLLTTDVTARREAEEGLRASEARFLAAAESIPDGLAILDAEDRFVFFNSRYPSHLTPNLRSLLRKGARFTDWIQAALEQGPIYHPDMGAGFVRERLAMHKLDRCEHEHKLVDGRWLRIRESRMMDGGRVLLTTDVTQRLHRERELTQLAMAVEQVGDPVEITDAQGRFTYVNPAFVRVTGYEAAAVIGKRPQEVLGSGQHDAAFFAAMEVCLGRGETWQGLIVNRRRSGELIYQDTTISPLRDASGHVTHYVAVKRDVTEQEKAEAALRESEARYRAVVEGQSEFILRLRPNGTLTFVNDAYCRYRGMTRETMLDGFNDVYHYPPEQQAQIHAAWAGLTPDFPSVTYELAKDDRYGRERWEEWTDTAIFAPNGRVVEYQAIGRDITERKLAEQALKESESRFRMIAEGVPLPIAITAVGEFRVLFANAKAREVFKIDAGAAGRRALERIWAEPAQRTALARRIVAEGVVEQVEVRLRRGDGSLFDALLSARPLQYGGKAAVLGVITDITERRRMEEALKASEARLAAFMENAPVGMYLKDREGRYVMANPEMGKVFGRPAGEMIGHTPEEVFAPDEVAMIRGYDREVMETGRPTVHEEYLPALDTYAWSMVIRFPIRNDAGEIIQIGGFDVDITRPKLAEAEVMASAQRFRTIAEIHPTPMIITRLDDRRVLFANRAYYEAFGLTRERLGGYDRSQLYSDPQAREEIYATVGRGDRLEGREMLMRTVDGESFPCVVTARGIVYEGSPSCVMSFLDLTALKRAEAALRLSEQRFRSIAEAHPMPLVIVGRDDGVVRFANEPFLRLFRLEPGELERLSPSSLYADSADRERLLALLRSRGALDGVEQVLRRPDGSSFPAALTSRTLDYEGSPAFVTSIVDLTEREAAQAQIQRQREALHQSEKLTALGSLLAGVAHELNNPLSVVVGYSSMLREMATDDGTRQRAERVHAAAERCARIVKTFLAMARSRPPQHGPVAIAEVIDAALELAAYGLRTADVEVVRGVARDLPPVWGDSDQLHQVFTNLIVNAQHALMHRPAPRRLKLRARRRGETVEIEVEDNGPGMNEEVVKRVFEPFFTTKPQGVGTGVGLSVCHGIVSAHEGRILVRSRVGRGTRFTVVLPVRTDLAAAAAPPIEPAPPDPQRARVLVVDDEKEIADLVAEHLRRDGLTVEVVGSGRAALARMAEQPFDLIISDLRMPDLDGPALVAALERDHPALARRVLLITGDALGAELNEAVRRANLPVLEKPLDLVALRRQVGKLLEAA